MARYNTSVRSAAKVKNYEGEESYELTPELDLYSAVVTSMLSNKFYETSDDRLSRIRTLIKKVSPEFVAQLAVYAREQMYLRTIPLVLVTELAKVHSGDNLVSRAVARIIQRVDEITELLACYVKSNDRKGGVYDKKLNSLSKQIKKGLQVAFNKFDEYQFAKYNRDGEIKLKDALFTINPRPKDRVTQKLFDKIAEDNLDTPMTWEVELSKGKDKKKAWEKMIDSGKLGYMATLRNLRNMLEADVGKKHLKKVASVLADPEQIKNSKQFPFRFFSAYREIQDVTSGDATMILEALEDAIEASAQNIAGFDDNVSVLIASDVSGSMQIPVSERSKIQNYDVGIVLSMLLKNRCRDAETGIFGDTWKIKNFPRKGILSNISKMQSLASEVGMSTNGYLVLQDLIRRKDVKDKVMFFTDMQLWDSNTDWSWNLSSSARNSDFSKLWLDYKKISPNAKLYLFDLSGYGQTPLTTKQGGVYLIAGWSDRIFDMLDAYDRGSTAIKEIRKITL